MKKFWLLIILTTFLSLSANSQSTLSAGDIAIVGMNCDNPDEFAFVPLVDLESGTVIRFTDDGWLSAGGFRSGEGGVEYTAPSAVSVGTVIVFTAPPSGNWSANNTGLGGGGFALSASGDQIIAFQGDASSPTLIYAVNNDGAGVWQSDASSSNTSALPTGLTNGTNAVALIELDNYAYTGGQNSDPSTLRSMVSNNTNWTGSNSTRQSMPTSPLPVELSSFTAKVLRSGGTQLDWRTETEVDNYGFEIERLQNYPASGKKLQEWEKIGFVEGHGNSNSPKDYTFSDDYARYGKYAYRLKQIDNDGKFEYSKVIEIDMGTPIEYELSQNYPNPFNPSTTIQFSIPQSSNLKLIVYNVLGEQVAELVNGFIEAGVHTINFNAENLTSGIYFYRLETNNRVVNKNMLLLK